MDLQRFSGPDLSELLDHVATEFGPAVAISAVNRVRSGGVAGFFCREEFEVIVDRSSAPGYRRSDIASSGRAGKQAAAPAATIAAAAQAPTAAQQAAAAQMIAAAQAIDPSQQVPAGSQLDAAQQAVVAQLLAAAQAATPSPNQAKAQASPPQPQPEQTPPSIEPQVLPTDGTVEPQVAAATAMPVVATEQLAAQIAAAQSGALSQSGDPEHGVEIQHAGELQDTGELQNAVEPEQADQDESVHSAQGAAVAAGGDGASEVFGGPRPAEMNGTDAGFVALLERRLDESSIAESALAGRRSAGQGGEEEAAATPTPDTEPTVPAPSIAPPPDESDGELKMLTEAPDASAEFWLSLQRAQDELTTVMPVSSKFVATIGPLSLTTPIVRRLRAESGFKSAEVVVLTSRTEIVSEPHWHLVRSGNQLVDEARQRGDQPTLLLIDVPVELPNWVAPLQNRLRMAGVGLFRYAVPGNPTARTLDDYRQASDVPYVLDLISRVDPEDLIDYVAKRHPIASVSGAELTAELLVAMREQVGVGR